jgi:hypothetical protein
VKLEAEPRSLARIEDAAWAVRQLLGFTDPFLPVAELIEFGLGYLASGFCYDILPQGELGERHGAVDRERRILYLREDVYDGLLNNRGRDRFTACHEMGHVILHGGTLNRRMPNTRVAAFRNPEWQANSFAAAILMPRNMALTLASHMAFREAFGVTESAAKVRAKVLGMASLDPVPHRTRT